MGTQGGMGKGATEASAAHMSATVMPMGVAERKAQAGVVEIAHDTPMDDVHKKGRTSKSEGSTAHGHPDRIRILYDAEILQADCTTRIKLACCCCSIYDMERSYLYVRENSIESNIAFSVCCGSSFCFQKDMTSVYYFDRAPYEPSACPCPWILCCTPTSPKLDVLEFGNVCCCIECPHAGCFNYCGLCCCCSGWFFQRRVVLLPFEKMCCGQCHNRYTDKCPGCWCGIPVYLCFPEMCVCAASNCMRCCGKKGGSPVVYSDVFEPQPANPYEFVEYAQYAMANDHTRKNNMIVGLAQGRPD